MTESYTPHQFINMINQANPSSPTFDPLGTHELRQRIEDNKRQSGDILAQAEQQVLADEQRKQQEEAYLNSPEGKIAKAKQEIQDMKAWLLNDQRYTPEEVDSITNKLTVEYDSELDKAIVLGDIILGSLKSAEGLQLPETVGGYLRLNSLESADGLKLPENIGGGLILSGLTSAEGLQLPETVGYSIWLYDLSPSDKQKLRELRPDLADKIR